MQQPFFHYDEMSDTFSIVFVPGKAATGIELNDYFLLRVDKEAGQVLSLDILEYSILAQKTETGPRSLPLSGLAALSEETRKLVIRLLLQPPVNEFLSLSTYTPTLAEHWPIAALQPMPLAA